MLLFSGVITIFGFLSTFASKIIKPTLDVSSKPKSKESEKIKKEDNNNNNDDIKEKRKGKDLDNEKDKQNGYWTLDEDNQIYEIKRHLKDNIKNLEDLPPKEFANFLLRLMNYSYYSSNNSLRK